MMNHQAALRGEWSRISRWAAAMVGASGVLIAVGCGSSTSAPASSATPAATVSAAPTASTAPAPSAVANTTVKPNVKFNPSDLELFVIKSGKPLIQANLYPEWETFRGLQGDAAQAFLCRRAAKLIVGKALARPEYQGKDAFVVRLIVLSELDEYGKPKWGQSNEVARLTADRAAVEKLTPAEIDGLSDERVVALFAERSFSGEAVARRP